MEPQTEIKNAFRLQGKVANIKPAQSGINPNTNREWQKLDILLSIYSDRRMTTYFSP